MSEQRRKLLIVVMLLLIGVLAYITLYAPLMSKKEALELEITTLETELNELSLNYEQMDQYKAEIVEANKRNEEIRAILPADLSQERAFKLLFDIEEAFNTVELVVVKFSEIEPILYSNELSDETTEVGIKQTISSTMNLSYSKLKEFLRFISDYKDRTVLDNLAIVLNVEDGTVGITLSMNMYGLMAAGRESEVIKFEDVPVGTGNLFGSPYGVSMDEEKPSHMGDSNDDLFIVLKPLKSDGYAQVIGLTGDASQTSYVKTDLNSTVNATLRIYVKNNNYYADYGINGLIKQGQEFELETALELSLFASERLDDDDRADMNITIMNETDQILYINTMEEDQENPRFNIVSKEGLVSVE